MSLAARHLEAAGIPTVVMGSARDIVEQCGVPRFLFADLPLGNPCGVPWDREMQSAIFAMALDLFESARVPRTTVQVPFRWPHEAWRASFMDTAALADGELERMGEERRALQDARRTARSQAT